MPSSLRPHGLQHARLLCLPLSPKICSNSCPLSWWCHPTISSSVTPFSSCPQSFQTSGSFPVSQLFTSGGQTIGALASASVLPISIQGWFPVVWFSCRRESRDSQENSLALALCCWRRTTVWFSNPTPGYISRKNENYFEDIWKPMFRATLFTLAKIWKQPKAT